MVVVSVQMPSSIVCLYCFHQCMIIFFFYCCVCVYCVVFFCILMAQKTAAHFSILLHQKDSLLCSLKKTNRRCQRNKQIKNEQNSGCTMPPWCVMFRCLCSRHQKMRCVRNLRLYLVWGIIYSFLTLSHNSSGYEIAILIIYCSCYCYHFSANMKSHFSANNHACFWWKFSFGIAKEPVVLLENVFSSEPLNPDTL